MRDGRPQVLLKLARLRRWQGRPRRPQARGDHRRAGARARASDARANRRHPGRHRHRACPTIRISPAGLPGMLERSPVRVVLDAKLAPAACDLGRGGDRARDADLGVCARSARRRWPRRSCAPRASRCFASKRQTGGSISPQVLKTLAGRGITRLMVEGGPTVAAAFVQADLVDEAALFRSPKAIGADGIDALEGLPLTALTQSPQSEIGRDRSRSAAILSNVTSECNHVHRHHHRCRRSDRSAAARRKACAG